MQMQLTKLPHNNIQNTPQLYYIVVLLSFCKIVYSSTWFENSVYDSALKG